MTRRARIVTAVVLVVLAWGCYALRRVAIGRFFVDGVTGDAPRLVPDHAPGLGRAERVRVVLVDGLSRAHAMTLPVLSDACGRGLDLVVDVGFPTVSLPVQHVLWTGLTQQQSGVQYRVGRIDPPLGDSLPARVPGSVAVAESHRDIVHSLGFGRAEPGLEREDIEATGSSWRAAEFLAAAEAAVGGDAPLVFVHMLAVDEAGHAHGGASDEYAAAATRADDMLGRLLASDSSPGRTRWFLLADHGHRPGGGHGDAEPEIRLVRACIVGGTERGASDTPIHLVDLHRAIAESLGLVPEPGALGRTLGVALGDPHPGATLPRPRTEDVAVGAGIALGALGVAVWLLRGGTALAVAWTLLSLVGVRIIHGALTLSNPVVYPPLGRDVLLAAAAGFLLLAWSSHALARRMPPWRAAVGLLLPALGAAAATAWTCRVPHALLGGGPPLLPAWSAWASVLATIVVGALATLAVVVLAGARARPDG